MNGSASVVITLALVFYSIGVWSERFQGRLRPWHLAFFWAGLVCDTVGTGMMLDYAGGLTCGRPRDLRTRRDPPDARPRGLGDGGAGTPGRAADPHLPPVQPGGLGDLAGAVLQPDVRGDRQATSAGPGRMPLVGESRACHRRPAPGDPSRPLRQGGSDGSGDRFPRVRRPTWRWRSRPAARAWRPTSAGRSAPWWSRRMVSVLGVGCNRVTSSQRSHGPCRDHGHPGRLRRRWVPSSWRAARSTPAASRARCASRPRYWAHVDAIVYGASRADAAAAGFDDAFIYEEIGRPLEDRRIPTHRLDGRIRRRPVRRVAGDERSHALLIRAGCRLVAHRVVERSSASNGSATESAQRPDDVPVAEVTQGMRLEHLGVDARRVGVEASTERAGGRAG